MEAILLVRGCSYLILNMSFHCEMAVVIIVSALNDCSTNLKKMPALLAKMRTCKSDMSIAYCTTMIFILNYSKQETNNMVSGAYKGKEHTTFIVHCGIIEK